MILPGIVKLFLLLLDSAINLLSDLAKFKQSSQHLVLFLLKSSLRFFKGSLQLLFLNFKSSTLFVKFMDRAATISKLVKEILNFISKIFVLTSNNIKLLICLIISSLQAEHFRVVVSAL